MRRLFFFLFLWGAAAAAAGAPASFQDNMAQRTLACTNCHGPAGRAGPDGYYPRIAGKPAGYLYNQLLHFREGRRHYGLMAGLLDTLSDPYMYEIALHFSRLDVPYPPPQRASEPAAVLERGRLLTVQGDPQQRLPSCASCHGAALTGVAPNVPGLLGLPRDYLNAQLGAWRAGQRRAHAPDCMAEIALRLTPEDLSAVTAWLAATPLPKNPKPAAAAASADAPSMHCGSAPLPTAGARP
jgi:cytochrome c553